MYMQNEMRMSIKRSRAKQSVRINKTGPKLCCTFLCNTDMVWGVHLEELYSSPMGPDGDHNKQMPDGMAIAVVKSSREETLWEMSGVKHEADKIRDDGREDGTCSDGEIESVRRTACAPRNTETYRSTPTLHWVP